MFHIHFLPALRRKSQSFLPWLPPASSASSLLPVCPSCQHSLAPRSPFPHLPPLGPRALGGWRRLPSREPSAEQNHQSGPGGALGNRARAWDWPSSGNLGTQQELGGDVLYGGGRPRWEECWLGPHCSVTITPLVATHFLNWVPAISWETLSFRESFPPLLALRSDSQGFQTSVPTPFYYETFQTHGSFE